MINAAMNISSLQEEITPPVSDDAQIVLQSSESKTLSITTITNAVNSISASVASETDGRLLSLTLQGDQARV